MKPPATPVQSRHWPTPSTAATITPIVTRGELCRGEFSTGDPRSPALPAAPPSTPTNPPQKTQPKPRLKIPKVWSNNHERIHRASKMFPKEDYGIAALVPVRPLLVGDRGTSATYLVEYPAGDGTYCFWDEKTNKVWRIVTPVKVEDLLACLYRADYDALYIDLLLPIMCDVPLFIE